MFDFAAFFAKVQARQAEAVEAAKTGLERFAAHVVGDSQDLAPVDTGALKASGTWGDAKADGTKIQVEIGHNTDYAAAVHERLGVHHDQGQAKFLETAMRQNAPKMAAEVGAYVKKKLGD